MKKPDPTPCTLFMLLMSAILILGSYNKGHKGKWKTNTNEQASIVRNAK